MDIELVSTRIKAILVDENLTPIATGNYEWQSYLSNGMWTYNLYEAWVGIQKCYQEISKKIYEKYAVEIETIGAIVFSGMMHGYLVFDKNNG